jgi:hypothetical protein
MKGTVAFYISGHGYGHAVRMAHVIRRLLELHPEQRMVVRTMAPKWLFPPGLAVQAAEFDSGAAEDGTALRIDARATGDRLRALIRNRAGIVAREASFLAKERASLIVADVPFLAGEVASAAGVPCIAIGNFTWDWIYEPLLAGDDSPELLETMREGYRKMAHFLRLPFGQSAGFEMFPQVTSVPLVASVSRRESGEILRDLGVAPNDGRKRILIGMRGGLPQRVLERAVAGSPDALFLEPGTVGFADLVKVSHVVVSKLGYGIAAACATHGTPLLYPPRAGFREDAVLEQQLRSCIPMRQIPKERFLEGDWRRDLDALCQQEPSKQQVPSNGDLLCAEIIRRTLKGS